MYQIIFIHDVFISTPAHESGNELDVIVTSQTRCLALNYVNTPLNTPYHMMRFINLNSVSNSKGGKRNQGTATAREANWKMVGRSVKTDGKDELSPPGKGTMKQHRKALKLFLNSADEVEKVASLDPSEFQG